MKISLKSAMKKADKTFTINNALYELRQKSFFYYSLADKTLIENEALLEQNKRLMKENNELKGIENPEWLQ